MEVEERRLWMDWRAGTEAAREQLLEKYLPFAKRLAASLYANRPVQSLEFGDYLHLAYVGLLEAMQRYRPDSEAKFATFASYRIRGAILNGIPSMSEIGDHISYLKRTQRERSHSLLRQGQTAPKTFSDMLDFVVNIALAYQLDELATDDAPDGSSDDLYASRAYEENQRRLAGVMTLLPARERQIVHYHYFHQIGFDDIADLLGITKGRVSQLHKRALETLRSALRENRLSELY